MRKFILPLIILLMLLTASCGTKTEESVNEEIQEKSVSSSEEVIKEDDTKESVKEAEKDEEPEEEQEEEEPEVKKNYGALNTAYLVDLGCTPEQINALRGAITESIWDDGPWYRFEESDLWYAFDGYDFDDESGSYVPKGTCTNMLINMNELISGADEYTSDTLEALGKSHLTEEYNDFYESNVYNIRCDGYLLTVIADSKGQINGNTPVNVKK